MSGLEHLRPFAETDRQHQYLDAIKEVGATHPSSEAAELLGVGHRNLQDGILRLKKKAALRGISNDSVLSEPIADGFAIKGTSTLYDEAGNVKLAWVKTNIEQQNQADALKEFALTLSDYVVPVKATPVQKSANNLDESLLSMLVLGDAHYATRSSRLETRSEDMDLPKTIKITHTAIDDLIDRSPNAHKGMFVSVGDALHSNSSNNTTHAGTSLDTSAGLAESLRAMAMTIRYAVTRMLDKFAEVSVVIVSGNHDKDISLGLRMMIEFCYEQEPRVTVLKSATLYHYVGWGKHMWIFHHGDKIKGKDIVALAAKEQPKLWGESKANSRLAILGHYHHMTRQEFGGMTVETHGVLVPVDKWHAESGYGSSRNMQCLTFKKEGGRHSTIIHEIDNPENEPDLVIL